MSNTAKKTKKAGIIKKFAKGANDTGSPEVQVALLTNHINELNEHIKKFPKDFASNRGLLRAVGQRRRVLNYLKTADQKRYTQVIAALELRK